MYHSNEGLFFERASNGAVRIVKTTDGRFPADDGSNILLDQKLEPGPWCIAVCSVSLQNETGERWRQALAFHNE